MALSACGGGGGDGGVASTPTPTPTQVATNASLAKLTVAQVFASDAATQTASFNSTSSNTLTGASASAPLTIQYDASSNSYTISTQGRSQSFGSPDLVSGANGAGVFKKSGATSSDYLQLYAATYGGSGGPSYVGMGLWQRVALSGSTQNTTFDYFAYGLATPASGGPHSGQAALATTVYGITTTPGYQARSFIGNGRMDIDFQRGIFSTDTYVNETELVSGAGSSGGGIELTGSGTLSSSTGTLSGLVHYGGLHADASGTLSGRLYGPSGQEVGAAFTATGSDGSSASGALIGYASVWPLGAVNLSLTNLVTDQLYYTAGEGLWAVTSGSYFTSTGLDYNQLTQHPNGGVDLPANDLLPQVQFAASDAISGGAANFTTYQKSINGQSVTLEIYKPGSANSELALSYASFAHVFDGTVAASAHQQEYEVFGLTTGAGLLNARTGSAHYSGVAYGAGGNPTSGAAYAVTGTSSFDVNFTSQNLSGSLALRGSSSAGSVDFGTYSFNGAMMRGQGVTTALVQGANSVGTVAPQFFGPTGQEIGAPFRLTVPVGQAGAGTVIAGAAVAKGG